MIINIKRMVLGVDFLIKVHDNFNMNKNKQNFKEIKISDNFYQSSSFFPMPLTLIGTLDENGNTSFGSYSLIFPYYIAGKEFYAMILECRNSSNTCKGILRHKKCSINFIPYSKKNMKNCVELGFPGDTPEEKEKNIIFTAIDGTNKNNPKILKEAYQVFECSWVDSLDNASKDKVQEEYLPPYHNFNGITSKYGAHFILKIDNILLKENYYNAITNGVTKSNFMPLPTNWGYRDSKYFWCSPNKKPTHFGIADREVDMDSLRYASSRLNSDVKFTDEALKRFAKVPRAFLKIALKSCVDWAEEHNVKVIDTKEVDQIKPKKNK